MITRNKRPNPEKELLADLSEQLKPQDGKLHMLILGIDLDHPSGGETVFSYLQMQHRDISDYKLSAPSGGFCILAVTYK